MRWTCSLVAPPKPTTAIFTSFEVYWATSHPASAAATSASPPRLAGGHGGASIGLEEDTLDDHCVGPHLGNQGSQLIEHHPQPLGQRQIAPGGDDPSGGRVHVAPLPVHHAIATPRQARVDAEDEHPFDPSNGGLSIWWTHMIAMVKGPTPGENGRCWA